MSTKEMYKKVPAMNRKLQSDNVSIPPIRRPTKTPIKQSTLDNTLYIAARFVETPDFFSTAKSPISCGSS